MANQIMHDEAGLLERVLTRNIPLHFCTINSLKTGHKLPRKNMHLIKQIQKIGNILRTYDFGSSKIYFLIKQQLQIRSDEYKLNVDFETLAMQLSQVSFFESMLIATDSRSPQLIKNITSSVATAIETLFSKIILMAKLCPTAKDAHAFLQGIIITMLYNY